MIKLDKKTWGIILFLSVLVLIYFLIPHIALAQRGAEGSTSLSVQLKSQPIMNAWGLVRSLVNVLAVLGLLFIAFANILHLQVDTYAVRRMLPALILGIILANFSNLICRVLVDFASLLTYALAGDPASSTAVNGDNISIMIGMRGVFNAVSAATPVTNIAALATFVFIPGAQLFAVGTFLLPLIILFIWFLPAIIMLYAVAFMLYARIYIIWFLVVVSPLAFFGATFSPVGFIWKKWWQYFIVWLFMGPAVMLILRIAITVGLGTSQIQSDISKFGQWIFGIAMLYLCLKVPGILGGALAGAVGAFGNLISGKKQLQFGAKLGAKAGGMAALNRAALTGPGQRVVGGIERLRFAGERRMLERQQAQKVARQRAISDTLRNPNLSYDARSRAMAEKDKHIEEQAMIRWRTAHPDSVADDILSDPDWNAYRTGGAGLTQVQSDRISENLKILQMQAGDTTHPQNAAAQTQWNAVVGDPAGTGAGLVAERESRRGPTLGRVVARPANYFTGVNRGRWRGSNFA